MFLDGLRHRLLVQCPLERADSVAPIVARYQSGLVLTGPKPFKTVRHLRRLDHRGPILCDAGRYTGRHRVPASAGLSADWTAEQHELGLVALTDSGYLAAGDWPGLHRLLDDAADQPQPLVVTLPLAPGWFAERAQLTRLITTLNEARLPVAIVGDTFVASGLIRVLTASVPVLVLRSDIGALGAVCHGAHAGALGVMSGLFVPALMGHHRPSVLARIVDRTPALAHNWPCRCPECTGAVPIHLTPGGIYRHSLHTQLALADQLRHDPAAWRERCGAALHVHRKVGEVMPNWPAADALRWWHELEPPEIPRQTAGEHAPRLG
ncbi:hypothetical protein [Actinophytocola oryzae]|uniref:tRNA-guanine family transglycosylase n=1 Tax=Actinophytocola oryzae TaxID=502181 RepID=A0A4R7UP84_9PSEU|nr:hypothetical protein [Actinophytocola oryzae]TDV34890.1 hypothetical protein CLV71_1379 [Actinophytocola oryzae]